MQTTGTLKEREPGLVEIGRLPLSSTLAASGTLSGNQITALYIVSQQCRGGCLLEIQPSTIDCTLFPGFLKNTLTILTFFRRELGPELEIAVVEMSLEQQVELFFFHQHFFFENLQVERIRARHNGNEQAVDMLKVEMKVVQVMVKMVEMGVVRGQVIKNTLFFGSFS